jgi:hypothetical protein
MALVAAGGMMTGGPGRSPYNMATLGIRSLREEYLRPMHRGDIPRNLKLIEERVGMDAHSAEPVASAERLDLPRFQYLFKGGELLPPAVFIAALEMSNTETINGKQMSFDTDVLILRDNLVATYKPTVAACRRLVTKEIDALPPRLVLNFTRAWTAWESAWLRNREVHAVEALQPLAKAILSLEPLLLSHEKERLLPWPRVHHQKVITLKCLEGFVHSLAELAACVLPSLQRELVHDTRLLLLMDHVVSLGGDATGNSCIAGLSTTPDVAFPDHQARAPMSSMDIKDMAITEARDGRGLPLDQYAFKLLGASVGDSKATAKFRAFMEAQASVEMGKSSSSSDLTTKKPPNFPKEIAQSSLHQKSKAHATELLASFENVKDVLLSLKSTLEYIDPALDRDEVFVGHLQRFERAFKRSKRLFLEPDNLA